MKNLVRARDKGKAVIARRIVRDTSSPVPGMLVFGRDPAINERCGCAKGYQWSEIEHAED